jgi:hypothetical protein
MMVGKVERKHYHDDPERDEYIVFDFTDYVVELHKSSIRYKWTDAETGMQLICPVQRASIINWSSKEEDGDAVSNFEILFKDGFGSECKFVYWWPFDYKSYIFDTIAKMFGDIYNKIYRHKVVQDIEKWSDELKESAERDKKQAENDIR